MLFFIIYFCIYFTVPEVQLKLDKPTPQGNKSIVVRWNVKYDKRLNEPRHFHMRFCPVKNCGNYSSQNFSNTKNATISDLVTYAEYKFQIRAVNITAIDGTNVLFPEGNFSEPVSGRTDEGGKNRPIFFLPTPQGVSLARVAPSMVSANQR